MTKTMLHIVVAPLTPHASGGSPYSVLPGPYMECTALNLGKITHSLTGK